MGDIKIEELMNGGRRAHWDGELMARWFTVTWFPKRPDQVEIVLCDGGAESALYMPLSVFLAAAQAVMVARNGHVLMDTFSQILGVPVFKAPEGMDGPPGGS